MELVSYKQMFEFFCLFFFLGFFFLFFVDSKILHRHTEGPGGMGLLVFAMFDLIANHSSIFLECPCPGFIFPLCSHQIQSLNSFMGASTWHWKFKKLSSLGEKHSDPKWVLSSALKRKTCIWGICNKGFFTHFVLLGLVFPIYTMSALDTVISKVSSKL